jgi:heme exporter protein B
MTKDIAISTLWAVHLISSLFALLASQEWEWESNALRAIKLTGVEGSLVFLAKSTASILSLLLLWILETGIWFFLFAFDHLKHAIPGRVLSGTSPELITVLLQIILTGAIASAGISFLGQIASVLALHSRFKHILLFIVFFPISLPSIIAGSSYTRVIWKTGGWSTGTGVLFMESAFAFFFLAVGVFLYEFLWEE